MPQIAKAYAMTDAKISFVSLVDKAANKKQFLITKSRDGAANFATYGRIIKADADSHYKWKRWRWRCRSIWTFNIR